MPIKKKFSNRVRRAVLTVAAPVLVAVGVSACSDFLDVNQNPNSAEAAKVDIRLASLITMFVHSTYYGETSLWGAEWTQQFSFNRDARSYGQVQRYELTETDASSAWDYFYTRPGNESAHMIQDASGAADVKFRGFGKLFNAWTFQIITDLWGPVPYAQAFDPTIREPKYDEQKVVYEGVLKNLDEAIVDLAAVGRAPTTNDLLYAGDMVKWGKLARNLQARTNLRLAYAPGEDKLARANKALAAVAAGLASNTDDADFAYPGGVGARNPLWTFIDLRNQFVAGEFLVNMLKARNDPRLPILFTPIYYDSIRGTNRYRSDGTKFIGGHNGGPTYLQDSTVSWINEKFSAENAPLNLMSYADQKMTEAEARFIVSGAAAADAPYRDGIRANMQKLGVAAAAIDAYINARPNLGTVTNPLEEIINQKYIINFLKVEPWNDWRRTGYPVLPTPVDRAVIAGIPQRVRTPGSELSNNITQVKATGISTGLEGMLTKVWWASAPH